MRIAVAAGLSVAVSSFGEAGVKTEEKTRVELGGPLGGILRVFGGKTAKEGIVTTTAVVDDRRLIRSGDAGQIVDLAEEAVYDLDLKKKTYTATSFAELKQRFEEERAKAEKEAQKAREQQAAKQAGTDAEAKEFEVDFEVARTAEKREIAGHEARLVILRATVHEKGARFSRQAACSQERPLARAKARGARRAPGLESALRTEAGRGLRRRGRRRLGPADGDVIREVSGRPSGHE
jgi:hypothetical protein